MSVNQAELGLRSSRSTQWIASICLGLSTFGTAEDLRAADADECTKPNGCADHGSQESSGAIHVSGLVPLKDLNRRPYTGFWVYDLRFHSLDFGFSIDQLGVSGSASGLDLNGNTVTESIDGSISYLGLHIGYYLPLLGYTPNLTLGLLPELHATVGGFFGGAQSSSGGDLGDKKLATNWKLPAFLMLRLGDHASRYSDLGFALGAGIGYSIHRFSTGAPVPDQGTLFNPALRVEAGFWGLVVGVEYDLVASTRAASDGGIDRRLSYRDLTLALSYTFKPDPDD